MLSHNPAFRIVADINAYHSTDPSRHAGRQMGPSSHFFDFWRWVSVVAVAGSPARRVAGSPFKKVPAPGNHFRFWAGFGRPTLMFPQVGTPVYEDCSPFTAEQGNFSGWQGGAPWLSFVSRCSRSATLVAENRPWPVRMCDLHRTLLIARFEQF